MLKLVPRENRVALNEESCTIMISAYKFNHKKKNVYIKCSFLCETVEYEIHASTIIVNIVYTRGSTCCRCEQTQRAGSIFIDFHQDAKTFALCWFEALAS